MNRVVVRGPLGLQTLDAVKDRYAVAISYVVAGDRVVVMHGLGRRVIGVVLDEWGYQQTMLGNINTGVVVTCESCGAKVATHIEAAGSFCPDCGVGGG